MEINMLQALSNFKTNSVEVKGNGTEGDFLKSLNNLINSEEFNGEENIEAENIPNVKVDIEDLLNIEFNEDIKTAENIIVNEEVKSDEENALTKTGALIDKGISWESSMTQEKTSDKVKEQYKQDLIKAVSSYKENKIEEIKNEEFIK